MLYGLKPILTTTVLDRTVQQIVWTVCLKYCLDGVVLIVCLIDRWQVILEYEKLEVKRANVVVYHDREVTWPFCCMSGIIRLAKIINIFMNLFCSINRLTIKSADCWFKWLRCWSCDFVSHVILLVMWGLFSV